MGVDKMASSAFALMQQQPAQAQEAAANVWITGACVVADCLEISLKELNDIENKADDYIRLEDSWNMVKAAVVSSITTLKGIFRLMDASQEQQKLPRTSSIASASGSMLRRLSNAFSGPSSSSRSSSVVSTSAIPSGSYARHSSVRSTGPVYRTPNYLRNSVGNGCPTSLPPATQFPFHKLSLVPPTPASAQDDQTDPFDTTVPLVPEIPALPAIPMPALSMEQRRVSLATF